MSKKQFYALYAYVDSIDGNAMKRRIIVQYTGEEKLEVGNDD